MINASDFATALLVSGTVSLGVSLQDNHIQNRLIEDNIIVVKELTRSVNTLNTQMAVFEKTYVTKDSLQAELKGDKNGS